jgi:hypothetical protein
MHPLSFLSRGGLFAAAVLLSLASFTHPARAAEVYQWDFTQGATDLVNGVPAVLANPAGLGAGGYTFTDIGEGISVTQPSELAVSDTYTIFIVFSLTENDRTYQRIIDFKNKDEAGEGFEVGDQGLYARFDHIWFYYKGPQAQGNHFQPEQKIVLALRRDGASKLLSCVVNGNLIWSFVDYDNDGVFSASNNLMRFFEDNLGPNEHPAGTVEKIRVFKNVLITEAAINQQIAKLNQDFKKAKKAKDKRKQKKIKKQIPPLTAQLAYLQSLGN